MEQAIKLSKREFIAAVFDYCIKHKMVPSYDGGDYFVNLEIRSSDQSIIVTYGKNQEQICPKKS